MMSRAPVVILIALCATGCYRDDAGRMKRPPPKPAVPVTLPKQLCVTSSPEQSCRRVEEVEAWLARPDLVIEGSAEPPAGIQGARVLTLSVPGPTPIVFRAKWRSNSTSTKLNSPRQELATHVLQKLFLDPHEYVAPPAAAHCFPLDMYHRRVGAEAKETFKGVPCVYGILQYWLENVQPLPDAGRAGWFDFEGGVLDDDLFVKNAIYRDSVANLNLLTYAIRHADSHSKQFLIGKDPRFPVVYSVDNSMAFGARMNKRVRQNWSEIRVPALPRARLDRLRDAVGRLDTLSSIADLERRGDTLVVVPPTEPLALSDEALEWITPTRLRVRLRASEIALVRQRLIELFARVDRGELRLY